MTEYAELDALLASDEDLTEKDWPAPMPDGDLFELAIVERDEMRARLMEEREAHLILMDLFRVVAHERDQIREGLALTEDNVSLVAWTYRRACGEKLPCLRPEDRGAATAIIVALRVRAGYTP